MFRQTLLYKPFLFIENRAILSNAMQEGYVEIHILKLSIMGPPAVGKTAFLHLLFNWPAPKQYNSTSICNCPIRAIQRSRIAGQEEENEWAVVGVKELALMLAQTAPLLASPDKKCNTVKPDISIDTTIFTANAVPLLSENSTAVETSSTAIDADGNVHPDSSCLSNEVVQLMHPSETSNAMSESTWIQVLDGGGQPQFSDVSRAFMHDNITNVIVLKLTQRLTDKPSFVYSIEGKQLAQPVALQLTCLQHTVSYVHSIISSKFTIKNRMNLEKVKPRFFIIGTYENHTHGVKSIFKKSIEPLEDKNRQLIHALREYKEYLVFYNAQNEELIFPVDNLCKKNRESISSEIRHRITDNIGVAVSIQLPLRWYMFEIMVTEESHKVAHGIVDISLCQEIARKVGIAKSEIDRCITYLHSFGLFLYFPILPRVVFTNPQYLLDMVTSLIRMSFINNPRGVSIPLSPDMQQKISCDGLFTEELLEYLSLKFVPDIFTKEDLILLLQYLYIIAPVEKKAPIHYFLPCALPIYPHSQEEREKLSETCEQLFLQFENTLVPQVRFHLRFTTNLD